MSIYVYIIVIHKVEMNQINQDVDFIKDRFRLVLYVKVRTAFEMDQVRKSIDDWKEKKNDSNYLQYEVDEPVR